MKIAVFSITIFAAIYLMSCLTPGFDKKATSAGITIIRGGDEKKQAVRELLSKCSPVGRIEALSAEQRGDHVINRALALGANVVHIYYTEYYSEKMPDKDYKPELRHVTRFWICDQPITQEKDLTPDIVGPNSTL